MVKKKTWKKIADKDVTLIWGCTDEECDVPKSERILSVNPSWHEENGTCTCECGKDCKLIEIRINT